jgi:cytochrome oxidase Cu insertion factor (SCO1/SenC/PrrC family)
MSEIETPAVRAPDFPAGLDWIDTDGAALSLAELRGKVVILDFWTYG